MASEFIGESYYIGRVMEFGKQIKGKPLQVRIGWFYRPKDVMARRNHDPRLLVATMHSDMNPLSSIRGRCIVTHQSYIEDLDSYKKKPDHFYYNQLFDRYILRFYDVLPVESVRNLPADVAEVLNKRYQYIVVEAGTASEYTDAHRVCLICKRWCASGEALKCIKCQGFHHMLCINPPMLRKPSKGFAFQCALCTKLATDSNSSNSSSSSSSLLKQSSLATNGSATSSGQNSPRGSPKQKSVSALTVVPTPNGSRSGSRNEATNLTAVAPSTSQDQKMSHMWPFRYFGSHADIQDIFDPDDRVYPRASSRVGARYQAVVVKWDGPGQILATSTIFDDPQNSTLKGRSRKGGRGGRPSQKQKLLEAESADSSSRSQSLSLEATPNGVETPVAPTSPARSGAVQDDNVHIERGGDDTVSLRYSKPNNISEEFVADYISRVKDLSLPLPIHSADMMDKALLTLQSCGFDADKALKEIAKVQKDDFDIKDWTPAEIESFEEGIRLYGHELFAIKKKVETRSMKDIVRFFYQWKKTERYQPVYSVFTKINKPNKKFKSVGRGSVTSPVMEVGGRGKTGSDIEQERASDDSIILPTAENSTKFECAHCGTTSTSMWRRAPGEVDLQKKYPKVFCNDCGNDWVRYVALPSLVESQKDIKKLKNKDKDKDKDKEKDKEKDRDSPAKGQLNGATKTSAAQIDTTNGVKRKRSEAKSGSGKKQKEQSREPTRSPSPLPQQPCAVCNNHAVLGEQIMHCHRCQLSVHRDCYGVPSDVSHRKWTCDTCSNNQNPTCSTNYNCVLCTRLSEEGPQAVKKTTGNNWAHILCAVWMPETSFVDVETLSPVESIGKIRQDRWKQACSICRQKSGACIGCGEGYCKKAFHVTCAREAGYQVAFEMQPTKNIKGGLMVPMIWCPSHDLSSRKVIQIRDQPDAETDRNALQTYVHYYKRCETSIPSAMHKSRLLMTLNPGIGSISSTSTFTSWNSTHIRRASQSGYGSKTSPKSLLRTDTQEVCKKCAITASPMWWEDATLDSVRNQQQQSPGLKNHPSDLPFTPPSSQTLSDSSTTVAVKLEHNDIDDYEHKSPATGSVQDEQLTSMICHSCYWDAKTAAVV
ncbi:putative PHD type zinc finger protein with BAH domain-containing protein [Haplosporangium sp. Z 27]|nr:putative PHD type zinc finger protein with BAH domain-containing protein [Haplosporangium sp. Z 27]